MRVWYVVRLSSVQDGDAEYQAGNLNAPCQNCFNRATKAYFKQILSPLFPHADAIYSRFKRNPSAPGVRFRGVDVGEFIQFGIILPVQN